MIVPEHWAEAREQVRHKGRRITVRRFGWSDESLAAAQAHANARAQEALAAILSGQDLPRRELRSNYGTLGVPIREQIVSRHGEVIVTRNSYGALCLNTPDVLFADMDFEPEPAGYVLPFKWALAALAVGLAVGLAASSWLAGAVAMFLAMYGTNALLRARQRQAFGQQGGAEGRALARVQAFASRHPDWHLRLYRTPAGLRVLAMHRTFSPEDAEVAGLFEALNGDRLYSLMCGLQKCFRARLTAKPWRIGMGRHIRPVKAAWSGEQATRPDRLDWIAEYERKAAGFSACRYLASLGDEARAHPKAEQVRALHDDMSRAHADLPLA